MNTRSLYLLAGATAVVAVVAAVTLHHGESAVKGTPGAGTLFPALAGSINDAATIELKKQDGVTTLRRSSEGWGLAEKSGYPVEMESIRKLLIGLKDLSANEARTEDPRLYSKLGVEEPDVQGSTSTLVTVKDEGGKELAGLIVGKEHASKSFTGGHQVYVRKPGEARSWLASGDLGLKEKGADWLDKKILEIKRERIRAAEIRHADGEVVVVDRDKPETKDFTLHDVPEGKELSYPSAPTSVADALGYLNLEDVVPADSMDMKEGTSCTSKFSCFDGLTITVTTKTVGDKTFARFEASYEKPPEAAGPLPPSATPGAPDAPGADNKTDEAAPDAPLGSVPEAEGAKATEKPKTKTAEEVGKEVAELNGRLSKWVYQIPSYNKSSIEKRKSELLKPPPAEPPSPESSSGQQIPEDQASPSEPPKTPEDPKPPQDSKPPQETKPPRDG
jgi:hypothetical protein